MLAYEKNIISTQNSHSARTVVIIQCNQQKPKFVFQNVYPSTGLTDQ